MTLLRGIIRNMATGERGASVEKRCKSIAKARLRRRRRGRRRNKLGTHGSPRRRGTEHAPSTVVKSPHLAYLSYHQQQSGGQLAPQQPLHPNGRPHPYPHPHPHPPSYPHHGPGHGGGDEAAKRTIITGMHGTATADNVTGNGDHLLHPRLHPRPNHPHYQPGHHHPYAQHPHNPHYHPHHQQPPHNNNPFHPSASLLPPHLKHHQQQQQQQHQQQQPQHQPGKSNQQHSHMPPSSALQQLTSSVASGFNGLRNGPLSAALGAVVAAAGAGGAGAAAPGAAGVLPHLMPILSPVSAASASGTAVGNSAPPALSSSSAAAIASSAAAASHCATAVATGLPEPEAPGSREAVAAAASAATVASTVSAAPNPMGGAGGMARECAGCQKRITERYMLHALDRFWHEDCLKCSACECRLGELGSTLYNKANMLLCKRDYLRIFGLEGACAACQQKIPPFEMVMRAKDNVYHLECFACQQCNHRFCVGDRFYLCDNKILCEYDYEERLVFANMAYNPSSLAHIRRQVSSLQPASDSNMNGIATGLNPAAALQASAAAAAASRTTGGATGGGHGQAVGGGPGVGPGQRNAIAGGAVAPSPNESKLNAAGAPPLQLLAPGNMPAGGGGGGHGHGGGGHHGGGVGHGVGAGVGGGGQAGGGGGGGVAHLRGDDGSSGYGSPDSETFEAPPAAQ